MIKRSSVWLLKGDTHANLSSYFLQGKDMNLQYTPKNCLKIAGYYMFATTSRDP
jgi:hypothetical protein